MSYLKIGSLEMVKVESEKLGLEEKVPISLEFPLIAAAKAGNLEKVQQLLNNGADVWEKDSGGRIAFHFAAHLENQELALHIAQAITKSITDASERKLYVNKEDTQQRTALSWAAAKGNSDLVTHLLNLGSDPFKTDINGETALHVAAKLGNNHKQALKCATAIVEAARNNVAKPLHELINSVSSDENNRRTALQYSVIAGNEELVQYLLNNQAKVLLAEKYCYTALHLAIQNAIPEKSLRLTRALLNETATRLQTNDLVEKQDQWGRTALHLASRQGNAGAIICLVEAGANVSQRDKNQNTALHLAASLGSTKKAGSCVERLLNNGLSPEAQHIFVNLGNKKEQTALYLAAKYLNVDAARKLLLAGSEYDIKTTRNKTPLEKVYKCVPEALLVKLDEAVSRSGYSARQGVISNYAQIDFGPILGKNSDQSKLYRETEELAKINHARLAHRQPVLDHTFVKMFIYKKWEKVGWCFGISRFLHILWYMFCLFYLMRTYREHCPFKSPKNNTVRFSISSISPPDEEDNDSPILQLNECNFSGFPVIGGIILIFVSILVLIGEIYPAYQRFHWYYKPLKPWSKATFFKNMNQILWLKINVLPTPQILIVLLVLLTSPPLFGKFPMSDSTHFSLVAAFAFTACVCIYLEIGRIPQCRVYVNLLVKISKSLFFAILVHLPILIGFASVFIFLLQGMPSFSSLPQALVKVLTLSIGELDYQNVIYDEGLFLYKGITMIAFGIFVLFITVVLLNFLVGLATDDIKESRKRRKEAWKLCTQIEQIMLLESFLDACGGYIGRYILKEYLMLMPPYRKGEQRRTLEIFIPSLPKAMQKELHDLDLRVIEKLD